MSTGPQTNVVRPERDRAPAPKQQFSSVPPKPASVRARVGLLGVGLLGNKAIVWAFDFGLYPLVMWRLGLAWGCVVMTLLSFLICYATLLFYDWAKKDWLGIEAIKELRESGSANRWMRYIAVMLRRSELFALFFLSVKFDPFIVTAYMRRGSYQFNGLSRRDWSIFLWSVAISNAYWSVVAFTGVSIFVWLWQKVAA